MTRRIHYFLDVHLTNQYDQLSLKKKNRNKNNKNQKTNEVINYICMSVIWTQMISWMHFSTINILTSIIVSIRNTEHTIFTTWIHYKIFKKLWNLFYDNSYYYILIGNICIDFASTTKIEINTHTQNTFRWLICLICVCFWMIFF